MAPSKSCLPEDIHDNSPTDADMDDASNTPIGYKAKINDEDSTMVRSPLR